MLSRCALSLTFAHSDLNLMVDNRLKFEGNMTYLSRLGHLTVIARNRKWRQKLAAMQAADATKRGHAMLETSRSERRWETLRCEQTPR
jgi:hypothetical protein